MPPARLNMREIFSEALDVESTADRQVYLDEACQGDGQLRKRVEDLLAAHADAGEFMNREGTALATIDMPTVAEGPGSHIGPYKLREQIGEGGFGVVYVAEQELPVARKVALKIIKPGMDTKEVIARFEAERQVLALMDHPNVARVLDAGATESGRPYFVMELVCGIPVTEFCDERKLSNRERLELFASVCRAVQHAHQKGIIHRDLKPSNILVTMHDDRPVPKVIDFGVAKALSRKLTEKTVYTCFGQMVGTPLYMSPEQAQLSGLDVDTRSDVYSLGVLLYELLTGTTPFDRQTLKDAGFDEIRRMIREDEPPSPSARVSTLNAELLSTASDQRRIDRRRLGQSLRGELDWIVMKALEKDRTRRYESASKLAEDIERFLNDEPVTACPPSPGYRFRKFARRNKAIFTTAAVLVASLLLGMVTTTWQAVRANAERERAEANATRAVNAKDLADQRLARALVAEQVARDNERAAQSARQIAEQAKELEADLRLQAQDHAHRISNLLASSYADRGQVLCDQGDIGRGMNWLVHGLQNVTDDGSDLELYLRANLAAWGREIHALHRVIQHESAVRSVAFSPDGSRVVTACTDGTIRLWDVATGRSLGKSADVEDQWAHLRWSEEFRGLVFSPDGSRIAVASFAGTVQLRDARTLDPIGDPLQHAPQSGPLQPWNRVRFVAFSPDGMRLATASGSGRDGTIRIWDADTLQPVNEPFQRGNPLAVRYCQDGLLAIVGSSFSHTSRLWHVGHDETIGQELLDVSRAAISPDGSQIASVSNRDEIIIRRAESGEPVCPSIVHEGNLLSLAFSLDGSQLMVGGTSSASRIWDTATGNAIGSPVYQGGIGHCVEFSPDGSRVVSGSSDGSLHVWNVVQQDQLRREVLHGDQVVAADFSPDGLRILTRRGDRFQLREAFTGAAVGNPFEDEFRAGMLHGDANHVSMTISPDGSRMLIRHDWRGWLRDVATGELIGRPLPASLRSAVFSPDGLRLLTGFQVNTQLVGYTRARDAFTGQQIGKAPFHDSVVLTTSLSHDGSRLLTGSGRSTQVWDAATLEPVGEALVHPATVVAAALHPNGHMMLAGLDDGTARVWDLSTRESIGTPLYHAHVVDTVTFSRDGNRFLTCTSDQTARLWDTSTRNPLGPRIRQNGGSIAGSFRPDGTQILLVSADGTTQLWEAPPGPVEGDREHIALWVEVATGLRVAENGAIEVLDGPSWQNRLQELQQLGGPPSTTPLPTPMPRPESEFVRSMEAALRGRDLAERGRWDEAMANFAMAIQLSEDSRIMREQIACWWDQLGLDAWEAGQHSRAETAFTNSLSVLEDLHQEMPDADKMLDRQYGRLGRFFRSTGRPEVATAIEQRRAALYPSEWRDRMSLGRERALRVIRLRRIGRFETAEEESPVATFLLQTVIDEIRDQEGHHRQLAQCHRLQGQLHASAGRDRDSLLEYNQALEIAPDDPWTHGSLANLLVNSTDSEVFAPVKALEHVSRALQKEPDNEEFLSAYGIACYRTGDHVGAITALAKTIPDASCHFYRAMAHAQLGQQQEAVEWYRRGVEAFERYSFQQLSHEARGQQLRTEAAELLGLTEGVSAEQSD